MSNKIIIAIDAMGGDDSPHKIIKGISIHSKNADNVYYKIIGNKTLIAPLVKKFNISSEVFQIIHTDNEEFICIYWLTGTYHIIPPPRFIIAFM